MSTTTATTAPRRSRRLLVPLATLAAAGALVVGSGADFTSASGNTQSVVTSGTFQQSNSRANAAVFNVDNIKPGDTVKGSVTITNTGSLPANFSVTETATNGFTDPAKLQMTVTENGRSIYQGAFGGFGGDDDVQELNRFEPAEARTFVYTVTLLDTAKNEEQGKTASAAYAWTAVQTDDVTIDQTTDVDVTRRNANPVAAPAG